MKEWIKWWQTLPAAERYMLMRKYSVKKVSDKLIKKMWKGEVSDWIYGSCKGRVARKHKQNGNVQFILHYAGTQGHEQDYWHDFDPSWWGYFEY